MRLNDPKMICRTGLRPVAQLFKNFVGRFIAALTGVLLILASTASAADNSLPKFLLPIVCQIGVNCWVQNLVDFDAGPKWKDPFCGPASFNKHKGTDIRLRYLADLKSNVSVLNMADGKVLAMRNDMEEKLVTGVEDIKRLEGKDCGNGALISHGNGWTTQLCHMAKGSLTIKKGDQLKRGQKIGFVGLSGHTTFPHVHVTLRKGRKIIDPFTGLQQDQACNPEAVIAKTSLWEKPAKNHLEGASTALLSADFSSKPVKSRNLLEGKIKKPTLGSALIFYANFINLRPGDRIDLTIKKGDKIFHSQKGKPLTRAKANWTIYAGRKTPVEKGAHYSADVILYRNDKPLITRRGVTISF